MITFKDLSRPLKSAVIMVWIVGIIYGFYFLMGFLMGIFGA